MNTGKFLTIINAVVAALNLFIAIALLAPMHLTFAMFSGAVALGCYMMMKMDNFKPTGTYPGVKFFSNLQNGFYTLITVGVIGILLNIGQLVTEGDIFRGVMGILVGVLAIITSSLNLIIVRKELTIAEEEDRIRP